MRYLVKIHHSNEGFKRVQGRRCTKRLAAVKGLFGADLVRLLFAHLFEYLSSRELEDPSWPRMLLLLLQEAEEIGNQNLEPDVHCAGDVP